MIGSTNGRLEDFLTGFPKVSLLAPTLRSPSTVVGVAQNIYDDPEFFSAYSGLPRAIKGLDGAPEWPAMRALLPELSGRRVLDLGCGFGWFCRWAAAAGASEVLGIDLSENMLARAIADTDDVRVSYERHDLDTVELPTETFDIAYSSLALHYVVDIDRLFRTVHEALRPSGVFVFSIEHPIYTAPSSPAFVTDASGHATWPLDQYLAEGPRSTDWLAPGVVKQHRTIGTYVSLLHKAGFVLTSLEEWGPSSEQIDEMPAWAVERDRPPFLLVRCGS